jgi:hypothetical protein
VCLRDRAAVGSMTQRIALLCASTALSAVDSKNWQGAPSAIDFAIWRPLGKK